MANSNLYHRVPSLCAYLLGLCVCISCSDDNEPLGAGAIPVTFTSQVISEVNVANDAAGSTRADSDPTYGIAMFESGSPMPQDAMFRTYIPAQGEGNITLLTPQTAAQALYYPADGSKVNFVAFAPSIASTEGKVTYSGFDNQAASTAPDFVWCSTTQGYNYSTPNVSLAFRHQFSKVIVRIKKGEGITDDEFAQLELTISNIPGSATCSLADGEVAAGASVGPLVPYRNETDPPAGYDREYIAIVPPHLAARTISFNGVTTSPLTYETTREYVRGKVYTYSFTLNKKSATPDGDIKIDDWETGQPTDNTVYSLKAPKSEFTHFKSGDNKTFEIETTYNGSFILNTSGDAKVVNNNAAWIKDLSIAPVKQGEVFQNKHTVSYAVEALPDGTSLRTGYIHISTGKATLVVKITQTDEFPDGIEIPGANCYILAPGGNSVHIPMSRAKLYYDYLALTADEYSGPFTVDVLWSDVETAITKLEFLTGDTDPEGTIKVTSGAEEGNAVIALRNSSGNILWSWHIWLTNYNPDASLKYNDKHPNNPKPVFMDRNLGALSATPGDVNAFGLYYQWGRKDPFPRVTSFTNNSGTLSDIKGAFWYKEGSGYTFYNGSGLPDDLVKAANTYHTALSEPNVFYKRHNVAEDWCSDGTEVIPNIPLRWNNANGKALDDPCPQGWKVPDSGAGDASPWQGLKKINPEDEDPFPWGTLGRSNDAIGYYPASGFRNSMLGLFNNTGTVGYCWSSAVSGAYAYYWGFYSMDVSPSLTIGRANGFGVRCVPD